VDSTAVPCISQSTRVEQVDLAATGSIAEPIHRQSQATQHILRLIWSLYGAYEDARDSKRPSVTGLVHLDSKPCSPSL
jgi:hypothetical protein